MTDDEIKPIPVMTVTPQGVPTDVKTAAVRYLLGQEASTVVLFLMLAFCGYMTYWHVTIGAPAEAEKRSALFKEVSTINSASHEKIASANNAAVEKVATQCANSIEKLATQNASSVDKLQTAIERMMDKNDRRTDIK